MVQYFLEVLIAATSPKLACAFRLSRLELSIVAHRKFGIGALTRPEMCVARTPANNYELLLKLLSALRLTTFKPCLRHRSYCVACPLDAEASPLWRRPAKRLHHAELFSTRNRAFARSFRQRSMQAWWFWADALLRTYEERQDPGAQVWAPHDYLE